MFFVQLPALELNYWFEVTKFENSMMIATNAVNLAPMLSVLFIGALMRALQMDPLNGAPPEAGSELLLHVHICNG